jgi:hypothetical protein
MWLLLLQLAVLRSALAMGGEWLCTWVGARVDLGGGVAGRTRVEKARWGMRVHWCLMQG